MLFSELNLKRNSLLVQVAYNMGIVYSAPSGLSYLWNFGSLALLSLIVQILTGVFLAMYYTGHVEIAFDSVEHIMRDIRLGWFVNLITSEIFIKISWQNSLEEIKKNLGNNLEEKTLSSEIKNPITEYLKKYLENSPLINNIETMKEIRKAISRRAETNIITKPNIPSFIKLKKKEYNKCLEKLQNDINLLKIDSESNKEDITKIEIKHIREINDSKLKWNQ